MASSEISPGEAVCLRHSFLFSTPVHRLLPPTVWGQFARIIMSFTLPMSSRDKIEAVENPLRRIQMSAVPGVPLSSGTCSDPCSSSKLNQLHALCAGKHFHPALAHFSYFYNCKSSVSSLPRLARAAINSFATACACDPHNVHRAHECLAAYSRQWMANNGDSCTGKTGKAKKARKGQTPPSSPTGPPLPRIRLLQGSTIDR